MITKLSQFNKVKTNSDALAWIQLLVSDIALKADHLQVFTLGDDFSNLQSVLKKINLKHTNDRIGHSPILVSGDKLHSIVVDMYQHTNKYAGHSSREQRKFHNKIFDAFNNIMHKNALYIWWYRALGTIRPANAGDMITYCGKIMSILEKNIKGKEN